MNEIEKLYKKVQVDGEQYCTKKDFCDNYKNPTHDHYPFHYCPQCKDYRFAYPPFTAEKQIRILKLILKKRRILDVGYIIEEDKYHCMHYECAFDSFEEALCADINYHWQDLMEEEKQQVKGILE